MKRTVETLVVDSSSCFTDLPTDIVAVLITFVPHFCWHFLKLVSRNWHNVVSHSIQDLKQNKSELFNFQFMCDELFSFPGFYHELGDFFLAIFPSTPTITPRFFKRRSAVEWFFKNREARYTEPKELFETVVRTVLNGDIDAAETILVKNIHFSPAKALDYLFAIRSIANYPEEPKPIFDGLVKFCLETIPLKDRWDKTTNFMNPTDVVWTKPGILLELVTDVITLHKTTHFKWLAELMLTQFNAVIFFSNMIEFYRSKVQNSHTTINTLTELGDKVHNGPYPLSDSVYIQYIHHQNNSAELFLICNQIWPSKPVQEIT